MCTYTIIIIFTLFFQHIYCDWVNEWLTPMQRQYKLDQIGTEVTNEKLFYDEAKSEDPYSELYARNDQQDVAPKTMYNGISINTLKLKLETTLQSANTLAETLKRQINLIESRERLLKEAIVNGRSGITTLSLISIGKLPKTYIIRDGFWSICNGLLQHPVSPQSNSNLFNEIFTTPRCIGQEIQSIRDPCAFNSVTTYETVPSFRRSIYQEDDYLCLKSNFNSSLEQYLSVPKHVVNETCNQGTVKSLNENIEECGVRILSDYSYYPSKNILENLPFEYCTGTDTAMCKLIVAWNLSNATIENFDILYDDQSFKKQFVAFGPVVDNIL